MPSAFTTPPVKMQFGSSPQARDKLRNYKYILSAEYAQSKAEGIQNRFYFPIPASCSYSCAAPPPGYFTLT